MIGDFESADAQLNRIAAAMEELSLSNNQVNQTVAEINRLTSRINSDMDASEHFHTILEDIPGSIYALAIDRNGYLPTHHSQFSKPMTGDCDQDLLNSRHMRIYYSNQTEVRRATSTASMLLQTYMRDTGEVIYDLSMPVSPLVESIGAASHSV